MTRGGPGCPCDADTYGSHSNACYDEQIREAQARQVARQNDRDRKERAVIEAARALIFGHWRDSPADFQALRDAVRALDGAE